MKNLISRNKSHLTLRKFQEIVKLASQPVQEGEKKLAQKKNDDYSGKKTRRRNSANTSVKQHDKSR